MPQMDFATYPSQLFWLVVFFLLFYGFMSLFAVPRVRRIIEARQARISDDLNHATTASEEASLLKQKLDEALAKAREQARAQIAAVNNDIRNKTTARDAELAIELSAQIESAEASIRAAQIEALASIEDIASGMVRQALPRVAAVTAGEAEARSAVIRVAGSRS